MAISPIHTKSGNAASVHEALDPQNDWKRFTSGGLEVRNCSPAHATTASEMAIHTPPTSSTRSSASSTSEEPAPSCHTLISYRFRVVARRPAPPSATW